MKAKPSFSLKDHLFNKDKVEFISHNIKKAYPAFKTEEFTKEVLDKFPVLELKGRISHISITLKKYLPPDYLAALKIIINSLPQELDPSKNDDDFGDFIISPFSHFVASYGCKEKYLNESLQAIKEITKRFSAEYAIRSFINGYPKESLTFLNSCATDDNYHVRRLASEGSRPKLPWGQKINISYREPLSILEKLYFDDRRFVTRSVANHVNDLSKLEPQLAISILRRWQASTKQNEEEMQYITKHALRTLIKEANKEALELIGYTKPEIQVNELKATSNIVTIGESLNFSFKIKAQKDQNLLIDYIIQYLPNGVAKNKKVFKIKHLRIGKHESVTIDKKHHIRLLTTRHVYVGKHQMVLQINGLNFGTIGFEVKRY